MAAISDSFYSDKRKKANLLLNKFGKSFDSLYTQTTNSGTWSNPLESGSTSSATQTYTVTGVTLNYKPGQVDNQNILVNDIKFILSAEGVVFTPKSGDTLTIDGKKYSVIKVLPLKPANITALYTLQIRAGGN